jgi:hypothetical protein
LPEPTGPSRVRVLARNLPIDLGGAQGRVAVADLELLPKGPDGILDLEDKHPKLQIHAARAIVPGRDVERLAKDGSKGQVADLKLLGKDRFEVRGTGPDGIPFQAAGTVGAKNGKLAFLPGKVDLAAQGAQIRVDISRRLAQVSVPAALLDNALRGDPTGNSQTPAADWPLVQPILTWNAPTTGTLKTGLNVENEKQAIPLSATIKLGVSKDNWLRFGLSDVKLKHEIADIAVDLPGKKAHVSIPADQVKKKVEEAARRELENPKLTILGPNTTRLTGEIPLSRFLGYLGGAERLSVTAEAKLSAGKGKIEARLAALYVSGPSLAVFARPEQAAATIRIAPELVENAMKQGGVPGLNVTKFGWPRPDRWALEADLGGTPLKAEGDFALRDGSFALRITDLETVTGGDHVDLKLDPAANLVRAKLSEKALVGMMGGAAPLSGLSLKLKPKGGLQAAGGFTFWGMDVPVRLDGKLTLGSDGQPRYAVDTTHLLGLNVTTPMRWLGLSMQKLTGDASWNGNILTIKPAGLPAGAKLAKLETGEGTLEVAMRPEQALPTGTKGLKFDGEHLEIDPCEMFQLPGKITSASTGPGGLVFDLVFDRAKLQKFVKLPAGVTFDGTTFRAEPTAAAGRPVPGTLESLSVGSDGGKATIKLDEKVFAPLSKLPKGVVFDGAGFAVDPKQGKALPGKLIGAIAGPDGLTLDLALTETELKGNFDFGKTGVSWDGNALMITTDSAQAPGARATGAAVVDGDLVVEVGDGQTRLPASTAERVVQMRNPGRSRMQGFFIDGANVEIRPKSPDGAWSINDLARADIKVLGGKVVIPKPKLDELIRAKLGPEDYKKLSPEFDGRRLIVHMPIGIGRIPLALRFEKTSDGNLQLAPSGFFGNIPLLEWPQRLIGLLLTPVSWLVPGSDGVKVDLKAASGVNLPKLQNVDATPDGLVLDFGQAKD